MLSEDILGPQEFTRVLRGLVMVGVRDLVEMVMVRIKG